MVRFQRFGQAANHDRKAYLEYQIQIGEYYLEHFVAPYARGNRVLDIGCGEGGVLIAFQRAGYQCTGLEYSWERLNYAREMGNPAIRLMHGDIEQFIAAEQFDVILMLDVIEHLGRKAEALQHLNQMLSPHGIAVISFPPFRSAFGGHQQVMRSFLKYIPFIHLAPRSVYRWLLENIERQNVEAHWRNYKTGICIKDFEKLVHQVGFRIILRNTYLVRPRQALRFRLKIKAYRGRWLTEYLTTGAEYVLGKKDSGLESLENLT